MNKNWGRVAVLAVAILFIGVGIARGEVRTLLTKSINLCLECIGLG